MPLHFYIAGENTELYIIILYTYLSAAAASKLIYKYNYISEQIYKANINIFFGIYSLKIWGGLTLLTLNNYNGLFHSQFWIKQNLSVGLKRFTVSTIDVVILGSVTSWEYILMPPWHMTTNFQQKLISGFSEVKNIIPMT